MPSASPEAVMSQPEQEENIIQTRPDELDDVLTRYGVAIDELRLRQDILDVKTTNGTFVWKIPDSRRRYHDALDRRTVSLYHPPISKRKSNREAAFRARQRRREHQPRMEGKGVRLRSHEEQEAPMSTDGSPQTLLSEMQTIQGSLKKTGASISPELTEVSQILQSGKLTKRKRNFLDRIVATIHGKLSTLRGGIDRLGEKIASLAGSIIDGSFLHVTTGYKAIQEHFNELLKHVSQQSVLHDLASKAYSKGLITAGEKNAAFAPGISLEVQANNFLELIRDRIKRDEKRYDTFIGILKTEAAYENLVILAGGVGAVT